MKILVGNCIIDSPLLGDDPLFFIPEYLHNEH